MQIICIPRNIPKKHLKVILQKWQGVTKDSTIMLNQ